VDSILTSLYAAVLRCDRPGDVWTRRNLERAIVLIGGMDDEQAAEILREEGL
jgi:hypothetical protein